MKKATIIYILLLSVNIYAQIPYPLPELKEGWERVHIEELGSVDIPPKMEVQSGVLKECVDVMNKIYKIEQQDIIIQQRGVNDLREEGRKTYARVMLSTKHAPIGEYYERINFNINDYSNIDIEQLNKFYYDIYLESMNQLGNDLIKWYPLKFEIVNGMSCIHISFIRESPKQKVLVNTYYFYNYDRMHELTMSYKLSDSEYWKSDFAKILSSYRIINIR
jgi:hypothetical protein